jgi:signal transduction histidine kinase
MNYPGKLRLSPHQGLDLDDLLIQILVTTLECWQVQRGAILLYDQGRAVWYHWIQQGLDDDPALPYFDFVRPLAEQARHSQAPVLIPRLSRAAVIDAAGEFEPGSAAIAPLLAGSECLGALVMLAERPHVFNPRHTIFLSAIAAQAALALSQAQLRTQARRLAMLEERYRLSREIHDGLAQMLSSLGWHLDHLKTLLAQNQRSQLETELGSCRQMVREAYRDVREAIDGLRLQPSPPGTLAGLLQDYLTDFERRSGIKAVLEMDHRPISLAPETELHLLRIVQEALSNVRKHAGAEQVLVQVQTREAGDRLNLTIIDDGYGFDPVRPRGRAHLGLVTMRERVASQNGDFSLVTGPNQGTRISITLPTAKKPAVHEKRRLT